LEKKLKNMRLKFKSAMIPFILEKREKPYSPSELEAEIEKLSDNFEIYNALKAEQIKVTQTLMSNQDGISQFTSDALTVIANAFA